MDSNQIWAYLNRFRLERNREANHYTHTNALTEWIFINLAKNLA